MSIHEFQYRNAKFPIPNTLDQVNDTDPIILKTHDHELSIIVNQFLIIQKLYPFSPMPNRSVSWKKKHHHSDSKISIILV